MRLSVVELVLVLAAALLIIAALPSCGGNRASPTVRASWSLTPGVLNAAVTQATIRDTVCRAGWTKTIRPPTSYTNDLKVKGIAQYGLHGALSAFQEDHLISLELGGNPTDPRNLWPEPYPRAAAVDQIENQLNHKVCAGELTLAQAQRTESSIKHTEG
ncbi:MAG TPA: hypothetical protein VFW85_03885 [Gaiellaceae bacterium]|nr:hypothetical protein [Gaiellaceae bacterium]